MHEQLPGDRHRQLRRAREVGLRRLAGAVLLRQHDLLLGAMRRSPPPHPALQRTQLAIRVPLRVLRLQQLEQRLGLELGREL
ncbi:MAG: hypothetical protein ACREBE_12060 [bacterium]